MIFCSDFPWTPSQGFPWQTPQSGLGWNASWFAHGLVAESGELLDAHITTRGSVEGSCSQMHTDSASPSPGEILQEFPSLWLDKFNPRWGYCADSDELHGDKNYLGFIACGIADLVWLCFPPVKSHKLCVAFLCIGTRLGVRGF